MSTLGDIHESLSVETYTAAEEHHRTTALRLLDALDAVLALHKREPMTFAEGANCAECEAEWPCPTVAAVNDALEAGK